jgi:hypothetical protein
VRSDPIELVGTPGDKKHVRSHCGETARNCFAGATAGTGYDGYLGLQCIHGVHFDAAAG